MIPALVASADPLTTGNAAPDFSLTDIDGVTHKLSDFKGKVVVLEWMNPGCPFVVGHYANGNMPKLQKKYTDDGVIWLTINSTRPDHPEAQTAEQCKKTFVAWHSAATANLMDEDRKIGHLYNAKTTPHMFIVSPDGNITYQGAIDDDRSTGGGANAKVNYVAQALDEMEAGKPVSISTTKSYGCSVKY
jgi:glutathione peroxidase-family protein